ncbi:hypothetical protein SAMN05660860_03072 [Geoalkalibacter ferrihydriticus]|uniref:Uncharacterized protein n=2 Tax=Geoalkalibacter ferrihydriticus TaxID=392333 RepID=A0A0C2DQJ2_9BACT|nr:hypothetical protein [Geoalkalibacter ferrihydriticus]KIH75679.1 hypothetical protein GFER_15245 [Geoalkalibacter ferrihydriticus DSM 17813]SDM73258.1 hypothetical protein SAMN05660860_03072 [Geoalkalibacter ferrihydriticus]
MDHSPQDCSKSEIRPGLGGLFQGKELKTFFINYLVTVVVVEGLIFFVCFVSGLAATEGQFPWKAYIFASFAAPLALTFIFAVIVLTFNRYLLQAPLRSESQQKSDHSDQGKAGQFLAFTQQMPFLLSLLLLLAACWIGYNMDMIALYLARAGETTARYFLLTFTAVLGAVALCILAWLILNFVLRQKKIKQQQQYRREVMERLGLVILDDNTVLDREGRPVHCPGEAKLPNQDTEEIRLLPRISRDA